MLEAPAATPVSGLTLRQAALTAGFAYLLNPVTFAEGYAMPHLVAAAPAQTVANLAAHPHLFAAAVLSYVFSLVGDVVLAWSLYVLLAPVNRALSLLAAAFQLVYAAVALAAVSNLGLLYRLAVSPAYRGTVDATALPTQAGLLLAAFHSGYGLSLIVFGLHLVVLGWLVAHASYLPRWLGWLLFACGWAWVIDSLGIYLYPNAPLGFLYVIFTAELVFMVWLLGWGWKIQEPAGGATGA